MKLIGKNALITGASLGFGYSVAKQFLIEGANILICARGAEKLRQAQEKLLAMSGNRQKVIALPADVSRYNEVQALFQRVESEMGDLDILVCNAGVYGPKGPIHEVVWEDWSDSVSTNLLGTVIPCRLAIPHFLRRQKGKVLVLSGGGATKPMPNLSAYATSKAAVVRFAETLAEELRPIGVDVNTIAPGALNTRLLDEILEAGPEKVGKSFYEQSVKQQKNGGTSLEVGTRLAVYLASSASDGITGKLISAVWDPWEKLQEHARELDKSDIYTLRRIVPKDRGLEWGDPK
jgi:NAD(P)-dependent dehydrogenase (short-subunit alcohol dehydrogenase family)